MTPKYGFSGKPESVLRYLRLAAGLTLEELARDVGITADDIRQFESGSRWVPMDQVIALSKYFGISCSGLLDDDLLQAADLFPFPIPRMEHRHQEHNQNRQLYRERIGADGEAWVVELERDKLAGTPYENAVNPNYAEDPDARFDILSFTPTGECIYIEVKATAGHADHPWYLTAGELQFVEECLLDGKHYELHRVSYVADPEFRRRDIYTAREVLERFDRIPHSYSMWRKWEVEE